MSTPTTIRYKATPEGFAIVVTYFDRDGLCAAVQLYSTNGENHRTILETSMPWGNEAGAIAAFNKLEGE